MFVVVMTELGEGCFDAGYIIDTFGPFDTQDAAVAWATTQAERSDPVREEWMGPPVTYHVEEVRAPSELNISEYMSERKELG